MEFLTHEHCVISLYLAFMGFSFQLVWTNAARLIKQKKVKHAHSCEICEYDFTGDFGFLRHKKLVHFNSDTLLTEKSLMNWMISKRKDIRYGPDSPRRQDFMERYQLRKNKVHDNNSSSIWVIFSIINNFNGIGLL